MPKRHALIKAGDRRCDAACWKATPGSSCACICGGSNHAIGSREAALSRTQADARAGRYGERYRAARYLPTTLRLLSSEVAR